MKANPYVGPRPFELKDKEFFFGRIREVADLKSLIFAHPTLVLYAESGAGKSSLVNAGLIPRLRADGIDVLLPARVRGAALNSEDLKDVDNIYVFNVLLSLAGKNSDSNALAKLTIADYLRRLPPTGGQPPPLARLLILDQFEELFTTYADHWVERRAFFQQLADIFKAPTGTKRGDIPIKLLFVMREDFIARLDPYLDEMPDRLRHRFRLERLRAPAAIDAIQEPARRAGCDYAPDVPEMLVGELLRSRQKTEQNTIAEVVGEYVEPVQLQVVCNRLWDELPEGTKRITGDLVKRYSDIDNALGEFYDAAIRAATGAHISERRIRRWFEDELITPNGTRGTVFEGTRKTGGIPNATVQILANRHLLRGDWRAGGQWYEITHDRFIDPILASNRAWRRTRNRRLLPLAGAAGVGLILLLGTSIWSAYEQQRLARAAADERDKLAAFTQLMQTVRDRIVSQPDVGLLLSIAAFKERDTAESRAALLTATMEVPQVAGYLSGAREPVTGLAVNAGKVIALAVNGKRRQWDAVSKKQLESMADPAIVEPASARALSGDGQQVATLVGDLLFVGDKRISLRGRQLRDNTEEVAYILPALSRDATVAAAAIVRCPKVAAAPGPRCAHQIAVVNVSEERVVNRFSVASRPTAMAIDSSSTIAVGRCRQDQAPRGASQPLQSQPTPSSSDPSVNCEPSLEVYRNGEPVAEATSDRGGAYRSIAFGSTGEIGAASTDGLIQTYSLRSRKLTETRIINIGKRSVPLALAFDDDRLVAGSESGQLTIFNLTDQRPSGIEPVISRLNRKFGFSRLAVAGPFLALTVDGGGARTGPAPLSDTSTILVWREEGGNYKQVFSQQTMMSSSSLSLSPDGTLVAAANFEDFPESRQVEVVATVWEVGNGATLRTLTRTRLAEVTGVTQPYQPDPDKDTKNAPPADRASIKAGVVSLAFSKRGDLLLGTNAGDLIVWNVARDQLNLIKPVDMAGVSSKKFAFGDYDARYIPDIAFSRSGQRFAAGLAGGGVMVGSWATPPVIDKVVPIPEVAVSVAFSADGEQVLVGTRSQGLFRVAMREGWDVQPILRTERSILQLAPIPDTRGGHIAIGAGRLHLVDSLAGAQIGPAMLDSVDGVAVSDDGRMLFANASGGTVWRMDLSLKPLVTWACSLLDVEALSKQLDDSRMARVCSSN